MKKLVYKINIEAPKQKVWNTMLQPDSYKKWVASSWPGSFYKGSWEQGEQIRFIGKDGSGTLAQIKDLNLYKNIDAEHIAILLNGVVEDTTSDLARNWVGITEKYTFSETDGKTELTVTINTNPEWEKMFDDGWPNALMKLKELCEQQIS
jgi:uncharacterized protein YndB with AHSA1/START domain